jgi:thiamine biosynthesis lipoprotein
MAGEKPTSRRDFLRGKSAARAVLAKVQAIADRAAAAFPPAPGEAASAARRTAPCAAARLHASRRAMACEFAIEYHAADGPDAQDAVLAALDLIDQLESQLTIYRDRSEVLDINRIAAERPLDVEPRLFSLLELCVWLHGETCGAFDITSGPLSRLWGFLRREGRVPAECDVTAALETVSSDYIELDRERCTIAFRNPGVEINLNAVGKGYALDRAAQLLSERNVDDFLCHGGRSSVVAVGRDRGDRSGGWRIAVPHPHDVARSVGHLVLHDLALGTSGAGAQFFEADGQRYGHLIDPRTGWPAAGVHTATVVAPSGAEADALSTAFYVMGAGDTAEYCATHPGVAAVLVCPREGSDKFDVHALNLDDERWLPS